MGSASHMARDILSDEGKKSSGLDLKKFLAWENKQQPNDLG